MTNERAMKKLSVLKMVAVNAGTETAEAVDMAIEALKDCELLKERQAEIERLNAENKRINDMLKIMFNRCICFRGSENCDDCAQREECESKRQMYKGWCLKDGKRVEKGTEQKN